MRFCALFNARVYPAIPAKGSVGASGDLAPLSHMAAALLGLGEMRHEGRLLPALEGLAIAGLEPMTFGPKEGVALINGTQVSAALGLAGLFAAEDLFMPRSSQVPCQCKHVAATMPPSTRGIHAVRRHQAQIDVAAAYCALLGGSPLRENPSSEPWPCL